MKENMIIVRSATDCTVVVDTPELKKTWVKKGAKMYVDRQALEQAYYDPSVEALFKMGYLFVDDKEFLEDVGLIEPGQEEPTIIELTQKFIDRLLKLMPMSEFKANLNKLTQPQIAELVEYAIEHYAELSMDKLDVLDKISGRNIMKSIANFKDSQEVK